MIAVEVVGERHATPVLFCHGLADSRLSARTFTGAASELRLRVIAPDRPGVGGTDPRRLSRVVDWVADAAVVLDALDVGSVALLGISAGGAFAAACAAMLRGRVRSLLLISPLGSPAWPTQGMATGQRLSLRVATRAPGVGGWVLGRLGILARRAPDLFFRVATREMPDVDRRALIRSDIREAFITNYLEAFRSGSRGVGQDLRVLTRPWGFDLRSITVPTSIHHGDADTTVPLHHGQRFAEVIPNAQIHVHHGHGHFSILDAYGQTLAALGE